MKFPIGGIVRERVSAGLGNVFKSGFGETPKPTVKSG